MKCTILIFCMLTACSAVFFPFFNLPNQRRSVMNVCIYSVDPSRYQPKCFLCPSSVYQNVLQACVNAASIPRNISYTQAGCIEQNCMISRGKRSVENELENHKNEVHPNLYSQENDEILIDENSNTEGLAGDEHTSSHQSKVMDTQKFVASDDADYEFEDS